MEVETREIFTAEDIITDPQIKRFFEKKTGIKEKTISGYISTLKGFCNFTEKTPTQIHNIHKKDLKERAPEFEMWLTDALDDYVADLVKNGYSYDTIQLYLSKIKSFLGAFRLKPLPETNVNIKRVLEDAKYALKVEDIRKAIKHSNPTYQTLIITQAQTGLALGDTVLLDVEDFICAVKYSDKSPQYWPINKEYTIHDIKETIHKAKLDKNIIGCFDLRRKKSTNKFYTFAGPETLHHIANILETRDEKYLQPDSPIFMKDMRKISKDKGQKVFEDIRLSADAAGNHFKRMHKERKIFPQITVNNKKRNFFRSHKIRHWFADQLRFGAELSRDDTKYLMGQKTGDVLERYVNPNNYLSLKNNYRKALPYLSITENVTVKDNIEAIERLSVENVEIRKENKELKNMVLEMKEDIIQIAQDPEKLAQLQKQVQNK